MALTEKQKRFVEEYLVDLNATDAARRAGYKDPNIGRQLITKNNVSLAIEKAMKARTARTEISQDAVLRELAAIGFANTADYVRIKKDGFVVLTPTEDLSRDQQRAIAGIKEGKHGVELKLHDKLGALHLLGQHLGMFDSRGGRNQETGNNIFDVINECTGKELDTSAIPELERQAESGDDLVE